MKTFVVGDIHGCFKSLKELYSNLDGWDRLIFLGDYIDRGPESKKVIDFLINLQETYGKDKVITLKK